jgi:predicted Zn-dependent protease
LRLKNLLLGAALAGALAAGTPATRNVGAAPKAAAAQSEGKSFTHQGAGITFDLPAGWTAEPDGDQLTVSPADESIAIVFWVTEQADFDAAAKSLGEELAKQIKNLKLDGEPKADTHNGMDHAAVTGSGQIDGKDIVFSADILEAKKPLIVLTFGSVEHLQKHSGDYSKLVKSIKKVIEKQ